MKFERSKVCIRTENHTSANTSRFFVPWEAGGPSPNQHASATPPRIWNIPIYGANIAAGLSGQKFERSKVCIRTENHTSANTSRFFVPWEAGGPSPNQHASATPPRIWNIPIYGADIAAGLSGQKFERSKICIRTENHTSANTSRFFVPWEAGGPSPTRV